MASGRTPLGFMDVGLRLRHDTSNIAVAVDWAAATAQWTAGGELLVGSTMAFYVAVQMNEYRTLADRALAGLDPSDPELAGYVRSQDLFAFGVLQDWPPFLAAGKELTTAPAGVLRANGWAMLAWLTAFTEAETARGLLRRAQAEYDRVDLVALAREAVIPFSVMG
jgi:hypothetical protein